EKAGWAGAGPRPRPGSHALRRTDHRPRSDHDRRDQRADPADAPPAPRDQPRRDARHEDGPESGRPHRDALPPGPAAARRIADAVPGHAPGAARLPRRAGPPVRPGGGPRPAARALAPGKLTRRTEPPEPCTMSEKRTRCRTALYAMAAVGLLGGGLFLGRQV